MSTDSVVFSIEGEVAYTDESKASFGAAIDSHGNIETEGLSSAFADALTTVKSLFTTIGGSLTTAPVKSTKVVKDVAARMESNSTIADLKYKFFSEYTLKTGFLIGGGGAADYHMIVAHFKPQIQQVLTALAGKPATIV